MNSLAQCLRKHGYTDATWPFLGAGCGNGWISLIDELITDLKAMGWDGAIAQIKEKFGGLRFYIGGGTDEIFERIGKAERKSYEICEACGQPGKPRKLDWIKTLCDTHAKGAEILEMNYG